MRTKRKPSLATGKKIAFVGAGNMAEAIIRGLLAGGLCTAGQIVVSDVKKKRTSFLKKKYLVKVAKNNALAVAAAATVILAVKPQNLLPVLLEIKGRAPKKLIVSIAAGINLRFLQKHLERSIVVRVMPNNPCLVGKGISVIASDVNLKRRDLKTVEMIFGAVGKTLKLPEKYMDAVTGLSGSGPAYVYLALEGMVEGGVSCGLKKKVAEALAYETFAGAIETVISSNRTPASLRDMVTSPGGTTIEGLKLLERSGFRKALKNAVKAAADKSKYLSKQWTF